MIIKLIIIDDYPNIRQCNNYQIDCSNDQDPSLQLATAEELLKSWNPHDDGFNKSEINLQEITRKICTQIKPHDSGVASQNAFCWSVKIALF